jgi:hypothetical protein
LELLLLYLKFHWSIILYYSNYSAFCTQRQQKIQLNEQKVGKIQLFCLKFVDPILALSKKKKIVDPNTIIDQRLNCTFGPLHLF